MRKNLEAGLYTARAAALRSLVPSIPYPLTAMSSRREKKVVFCSGSFYEGGEKKPSSEAPSIPGFQTVPAKSGSYIHTIGSWKNGTLEFSASKIGSLLTNILTIFF